MKHKKLKRHDKKRQIFQNNSTKKMTEINDWKRKIDKHNCLLESIIHSISCCESAGYKKFSSFLKLLAPLLIVLTNGVSKINVDCATDLATELVELMDKKQPAGNYFTYNVCVYLCYLGEILIDIKTGKGDKFFKCRLEEHPLLNYVLQD